MLELGTEWHNKKETPKVQDFKKKEKKKIV